MKHLTYGIITFFFPVVLLISCGEKPAEEYAKKFCICSKNLSEAVNQVKLGNISQDRFNQISKEHETCMGDNDPLKSLKENPAIQEQFKADFLKELEIQCPDIARNMGF